jgi:hypothetical protein
MDLSLNDVITWGSGLMVVGAVKMAFGRIEKNSNTINELKATLPEKYVQKADYKEDVRELKEMLREVRDDIRSRKEQPNE